MNVRLVSPHGAPRVGPPDTHSYNSSHVGYSEHVQQWRYKQYRRRNGTKITATTRSSRNDIAERYMKASIAATVTEAAAVAKIRPNEIAR